MKGEKGDKEGKDDDDGVIAGKTAGEGGQEDNPYGRAKDEFKKVPGELADGDKIEKEERGACFSAEESSGSVVENSSFSVLKGEPEAIDKGLFSKLTFGVSSSLSIISGGLPLFAFF